MNYQELPVYEQKQRILDALEHNRAVVVQSPTGSGKTTQIPIILHEAGYSNTGIIAVTQPRRIAALSVSEFIAKQLNTTYPGLVGYKMRFEDKTDNTTKIKIMTDGILLQEMKLDPWLSKYSVIMVDEAHERSLNIDFVLGLLKRVLQERSDFKVIVSSATMNAEVFSQYFDNCPIVNIDTITYPVTLVYDPPKGKTTTASLQAQDELLLKIENTIARVLANKVDGDILCFLPGEKIIKDCMKRLMKAPYSRKIHIVPLYGRLAKEEQERVFDPAPHGKKKVIISTNIAETSVTIAGVTTVIDTGLAKLNYYNPRTFTSSLNETEVSKASCNQRKGRAGRTQPGTCYRLYPRKDFETRPLYTLEEIYRTDLCEVVLRMAELGITEFEKFDFIAPPGQEGIIGGIETLEMLGALNKDRTLTTIGNYMVAFPLSPRESRIIVESMMNYPDVMDEVLTAVAFLSTHSPFILPPGEEMNARVAHHNFRDMYGDFVTYLKIYKSFEHAENKTAFCKSNYFDERVLSECVNIKEQLTQIVSSLGMPIISGGSKEDYLTCIASGMIQFICMREKRDVYRSVTAEHIQIHPGSVMFKADPLYIVAGEIVRTSRMFAMSVSPLTKNILSRLDPTIEQKLRGVPSKKQSRLIKQDDKSNKKTQKNELKNEVQSIKAPTDENSLMLGNVQFDIKTIKGKKHVILPIDKLKQVQLENEQQSRLAQAGKLKSKVIIGDYTLMQGEKLSLVLKIASHLDLYPMDEDKWKRNLNVNSVEQLDTLIDSLKWILRTAIAKRKSKELGFIGLFTDSCGNYWYSVSRGFSTAQNESLSSLETLIDECSETATDKQTHAINKIFRKLHALYDSE